MGNSRRRGTMSGTGTGLNIEYWYCINRSTTPMTFYEADDLLNQSVNIFTRSNPDAITYGTDSFIPIPVNTHVIIAAAKICTLTAGTLTVNVQSTSMNPVTLYILDGATAVLTTATLHSVGGVGRVGGSMVTSSLSMTASTEYTVMLVQTNPSINNTMFVQTNYTGARLPLNNGYVGGAPTGVILESASSSLIAVSDYKWSARTTDFDGWLLCDGRAIFRDAYPALFAVIGTSFGTGDGSTTFNIPNAQGRVCSSVMAGRTLGLTVGEETHTLAASEMPSHNHSASSDTAANHTHTFQDAYFAERTATTTGTFAGSSTGVDFDNGLFTRAGVTDPGGSHSHNISIAASGGGAAHNNMQPTIYIGNLFICAEI